MNFNLDFLRFRFIALIASVSFILVSLATISIQQLQLGLDFTGGTLVEVGFSETVDPEEIRTYLEEKQIDALLQAFGSDKDLLIKIPSSDKCYMLWEDGVKTTWEVGQPQVHYVMDKEHEGFNYSDEEMIFLMLDVKKSTEVIL